VARIFLSHSSSNNGAALAVRDWLLNEGWDDIFLDLDPERGLKAGERWQDALKKAASRCELVIFLISPAWTDSKWCLAEFLLAKQMNKRIFGVIVEQTPFELLPGEMTSEWQLVDLTAGRLDHEKTVTLPPGDRSETVAFSGDGLKRMRLGLLNSGLDPKYFEWPPENDPERAPFRGLKPLEAEDAGIFFGRDGPIVEVLDRLRGLRDAAPPRMLVILGASGAGKSSFMRAGLLPRLDRDHRHFVILPVLRPNRAIISGEAGLVAVLETALKAADRPCTKAEIRKAVNAGADALGQLFAALIPEVSEGMKAPTLILPIDQGEELFLAEGAEEGQIFLSLLSDLLGNEKLSLTALVTIRSDSYEPLQAVAELETVTQQTFSLPPMPRGSYSQIIEGPSERLAGSDRALIIDSALVDALLTDIETGGAKDALPLLAFTLERLFSEHGGDGQLGLADYEEFGRVKGSIESAVEQALKAADANPAIPRDKAARLALMRHGLIPWLAGIDPDSGAPRRRVAKISEIPAEALPLVELLVEQRLLSTDLDRVTNERTVEPAHEALLRQWGLLEGWLEEDFEDLAVAEGVRRAAREWHANARDAEWLAHAGGRLEAAEAVSRRPDITRLFAASDHEYLNAARGAEQARQREETDRHRRELEAARSVARRTLMGLAASLVLAVVAGIAGFFAYQNQKAAENQALIATQQREAAVEQRNRADEALQTADAERQRAERESDLKSAALEQSIRNETAGLAAQSYLTRLTQPEDNLKTARLLALAAWPVDAADPRPQTPEAILALAGASIGPYLHKLQFKNAQYLQDIGKVLTWDGNRARLWEPGTGQPLGPELKLPDKYMSILAIDRSGTVALIKRKNVSTEEAIHIWDLRKGNDLAPKLKHKAFVSRAVFSRDESRILSWAWTGSGGARVWDRQSGQQVGKTIRHTSDMHHAEFDPSEQRILATGPFAIQIHSAETGSLLRRLRLPDRAFVDARFNPSGSFVVAWSKEWQHTDTSKLHIWDSRSGTEIRTMGPFSGDIEDVLFVDRGRFVTWHGDGTIRTWTLADGAEFHAPMQHSSTAVKGAVHNAEKKQLLAWSQDGAVRIWNLETGLPTKFAVQHNGLKGGFFLEGGERVVTWAPAQNDNSRGFIATWDAASGMLLGNPDTLRAGDFKKVVQLPGTDTLLTTWSKGSALWDIAKGRPVHARIGEPEYADAGVSAVFDHAGGKVLTSTSTGEARIWDAYSGNPLTPVMNFGCEGSAIFNSDASRVVTFTTLCTEARIWDAKTGLPLSPPLQHEGQVTGAIFSPDDRYVVTHDREGNVFAWDAANGRSTGKTFSHSSEAWGADFTPNGDRLLTWSWDKTAKIWDFQNGHQIGKPLAHPNPLKSGASSSTGAWFMTWTQGGDLHIWDSQTAQPVHDGLTVGEGLEGAIVSPIGETIVGWSGTSARLWSVGAREGDPVTMEMSDRIAGAAFSPDARFLLLWTHKYAQIWNVSEGRRHGQQLTVDRGIDHAEFFADGNRVLVSDQSGLVTLFDVTFTTQVGNALQGSVFHQSPDGKHILTSVNGRYALWDVGAFLKGDVYDFVCATTGAIGNSDLEQVQTESGFKINDGICGPDVPDPREPDQK